MYGYSVIYTRIYIVFISWYIISVNNTQLQRIKIVSYLIVFILHLIP